MTDSRTGALRVLYITTPRYDFTTATLVQGFNALPFVELRTTSRGNYAAASQVLSRDDAVAYGRTADLVLWGYSRGADGNIFTAIDNPGPIRLFIDGGDNSELSVSLKLLPTIDLVFKRELLLEDRSVWNLLRLVIRARPGMWGRVRRHPWIPFPSFVGLVNRTRPKDLVRNVAVRRSMAKFRPLPYGIEERFQGTVNPRPAFELSCMIDRHMPERADLVAKLTSLGLPRAFIGQIPTHPDEVQRLVSWGAVNPDHMRRAEHGHNVKYYTQIADSRRCISVPGGGFDTLRFWEILGLGSLLVSKRIAIEMPHPLVEGTHYLAFDTFGELRDVLERSYRCPDEADEIRARGSSWAMQFHTTRARAEYLLSAVVDCGLLPRERLAGAGAAAATH